MAEPGDLPSNGVNIIIQNEEGDYLLVNDYKQWSLPGGGIKRGETSIKAAIRETEEETGLKIIRPIMIADIQLVINWKHKVILFKAIEWSGVIDPMIKKEIREAKFFKGEEVKSYLGIYPAQLKFIQIFEAAWLKLPIPVFAVASNPLVIEW